MKQGKKILERLLSSDVKGELLMLFHRNPGLIDTMDGVALRIGRSGADIRIDVKDFVEMGLLRRKKLGRLEVVSLNTKRDREIQAELTKHFRGAAIVK